MGALSELSPLKFGWDGQVPPKLPVTSPFPLTAHKQPFLEDPVWAGSDLKGFSSSLHAHFSFSSACQEVMCFNAKLKILEHRQQRIAEVRAKYEWLMKELEMTKQYLMLDPNKWLSECKA